MTPGAGENTGGRLWRHLTRTIALAVPVVVARSGWRIMIAADVIMTGRAGARELANYGLGFALAQLAFAIGLGYLVGTTILTAQANGQGRSTDCGVIWHVSMGHALLWSLCFIVLSFKAEAFFLLMGQSPDAAAGGAATLRMFAWGFPGLLLYVATVQFLDGLSRSKPNMILMLAANGVNIALNWLFIYDHPWAAGMGAEGAALATTITRWLMCLGLAGYVLVMPGGRRYGIGTAQLWQPDVSGKLIRIGLPAGLANGLESSAMATIALLAGLLGTIQLAAYQVAQNLFVIVFMLAIGIATAASVRVGNAVGRRSHTEAAWAGWTAIAVCLSVMLLVLIAFQVFPGLLAGIYSSDRAVIAMATTAIAVTSYLIVADGLQGVVVRVLRSTGDIWIPTVVVTAGFWGVAVPVGYYAAFTLSWGVDGLLWGITAGASAATLLLLFRFHKVIRREIAPI